MNQPTPAERAKAYLQEETQLLIAKAQVAEQTAAIDARLAQVRAALDGIRLGQALAAQAAAQADARAAEDDEAI